MKRNIQKTKIVKALNNKDEFATLLELMTYYNLSYSIGYNSDCIIKLNDKDSEIITPDIIYKIDNLVYVKLYLLSNKVISNIYKLIEEEL